MYQRYRWPDDRIRQTNEDRRTAGLAALAVVLLLLIGGLFLVQHLLSAARLENCLMSGRRNCDIVVAQRR